MHIGTGIYEGKEIKDPLDCGDISCRTLTIKEEIFTIISTRVNEASVLDVNDSNGMYGIEALSRGASCCRFVNPKLEEVKLTKENLKKIGLDPADLVLRDKIEEFIKNPIIGECVHEKYDVIFFEMREDENDKTVELLLGKQENSGITVIIYPNSATFNPPKVLDGFQVVETREFEDKKVVVILKTGI